MKLVIVFFILLVMTSFQFSYADVYSDSLSKSKLEQKDPSEAGLRSGRYQVRQAQSEEIIYPAKNTGKKRVNKKPASEGRPVVYFHAPASEEENQTESNAVKDELINSGMKEQVQGFFNGKQKKFIESYREQIHPDDVRMNKIEIDVGTGVDYNFSTGNIAYRKHYSSAPVLTLGGRIWLTPLFGFSGNYKSTYGESVYSATSSSTQIPVRSEWLELSIDFRKFYGLSRRSNNLQYGLLYSEYKFLPPTDETSRLRTRSSGIGVYIKARFPVAPSYSWTLGGEVLPLVSHAETKTGLLLQSGSSVSSSRIGLQVGGEFKLSRENQMIWNLGYKLERNQFDGTANMTDPDTGITPSGVNITNSWTYLQLVYRWGH